MDNNELKNVLLEILALEKTGEIKNSDGKIRQGGKGHITIRDYKNWLFTKFGYKVEQVKVFSKPNQKESE